MNILLVNHYAGHPKLGMEFRPYYMARQWQQMGHSVNIVASSYSHLRHTQPTTTSSFQNEDIEGVSYTWLESPQYKGNGLGRLINIFKFLWQLWKWEKNHNTFQPDVVIASSTYPFEIYLCHWIAKRHNAKLIFEVHDLWPLSPIELGGISKWHPLMMLMQHGENYAYKHADQVVSILPKTLEHMKDHGLSEEKFTHIPNGIVVEDWNPSVTLPTSHQKLIDQLKNDNKFIVGYAGAIGVANNMMSLVEAALRVRSEVSFIVMGQGPEKNKLILESKRLHLTNIHFLDPVDKNQVPCFLEQMDAVFLSLQQKPIYRFGVSLNKLFDYMMAGKPIIYSGKSGNRPVWDAKCGLEIPNGNPNDIAQSINSLVDKDPEAIRKMGASGKAYVTNHHDYKVLAQNFIEVMASN